MEKFYHIGCSVGDVGEYVLLPGDPGRTDLIASHFENAKLVANNREFRTWTGYLDGTKVSVTSTGIGQASTAIAVEELIGCGSHTFIRVGTAGRVSSKALDPKVRGVICTAAIRDEGLTREYVPIEYPAVADYALVGLLKETSTELGLNYITGIAHSKESYYGQMEPNRMPMREYLDERWKIWERSNVACAEMESSTLFTLATIYDKRAASIMCFEDMDETIELTINMLRKLIHLDSNK